MLSGIRYNAKNKYSYLFCPLCSPLGGENHELDTQHHLWTCVKLTNSTEISCSPVIDYDDIFSTNEDKQAEAAKVLMNKYEKRKTLLSQISDTN